jgi:hypothetical protein
LIVQNPADIVKAAAEIIKILMYAFRRNDYEKN